MIRCAMQSTNSLVKNIIRSSRISSKELSSIFELTLNSISFSVKLFIFFSYKFCLRRAFFLLNDQETIIKSKKIICDEIDFIILNKREI